MIKHSRSLGANIFKSSIIRGIFILSMLASFSGFAVDSQNSTLSSAARQGDAEAQYYLGWKYLLGDGVPQDYKQAEDWLRKASAQGMGKAHHALGQMYDRGLGVNQDYKQAVTWYRKAAEQGVAPAQNDLGAKYFRGEGVLRDYKQAEFWFRKAAEQGYINAQQNLGAIYLQGEGIPQDYKQAATWYRKAAEQGDVTAQFNLGAMYENGHGVPQDYKQAVAWYHKAAEQGYVDAQHKLKEISKKKAPTAQKSSKKINAVDESEVKQAAKGTLKVPHEVSAFKKDNIVCVKGRVTYEDDGKVQCQTTGVKASFNYGRNNYMDVTVTMDVMKPENARAYFEVFHASLSQGLKILGKNPRIADDFKSLPLSPDWNKPTIIKGVEFNIPDEGGIGRYGNYMVTVTK